MSGTVSQELKCVFGITCLGKIFGDSLETVACITNSVCHFFSIRSGMRKKIGTDKGLGIGLSYGCERGIDRQWRNSGGTSTLVDEAKHGHNVRGELSLGLGKWLECMSGGGFGCGLSKVIMRGVQHQGEEMASSR